MVKRKAEGHPCIEAETEVCTPEYKLAEDLSTSEQDLTADPPTGRKHREETLDCHLDPVLVEVDEGSDLGDSPFWALLSLVGYETW